MLYCLREVPPNALGDPRPGRALGKEPPPHGIDLNYCQENALMIKILLHPEVLRRLAALTACSWPSGFSCGPRNTSIA